MLLGCAHAGIINRLEYVRRIAGKPVYTVVGGTHLVGASPLRIERTIDALRALDVKRIGPAHCTGPRAAARLWRDLPGRCMAFPTGTTLRFAR